ncbi:hypothetical protein MS3_00009508 [Schistosoma haematobium]|uniref:Uncharacterized protein n=1 Tax=Schistosoma haematobium TaxID=6185 RepID=A0A094ZHB6_SCHHA|nr:hypothetical protein MS3_00009508 [Schistosoma haematobium]KAH9579322.1 hypothetical protein MS3_00009508 [Schistosoma haematobium]
MITEMVITQIENVTTIINTTMVPINLISTNDTSISTSQQSTIHHDQNLFEVNNQSNRNSNQIITFKSPFELNTIQTNSFVKGIRNTIDKPLAGLIIIGILFLTISILLGLIVLIFYKKRNTVFVYEKSQHGGLYSPGDQSIVIGQTMEARKIGNQLVMMHKHDSLYSFNDDDDSYNDSDVDVDNDDDNDYGEISFTNTNHSYHGNNDVYKTIFKKPIKASYILRSEYDLIRNPQSITVLSDQKKFINHEQSYVDKMNEVNKKSKSHGNQSSLNSSNVIINPTFTLCPKHAQLIANRK